MPVLMNKPPVKSTGEPKKIIGLVPVTWYMIAYTDMKGKISDGELAFEFRGDLFSVVGHNPIDAKEQMKIVKRPKWLYEAFKKTQATQSMDGSKTPPVSMPKQVKITDVSDEIKRLSKKVEAEKVEE